MPKQGMARPDGTHPQPRNDVPPVPGFQGKAKRIIDLRSENSSR